MAAFMNYDGLKDSGTFKLDNTTKNSIASNPKNILGKVVAFVAGTTNDGNPLVGYGTANDAIAGVVTAWDYEETGSQDIIVTVSWNSTFDNIATAATTTTAVVGAGIAVNGSGGVVTKPELTNAFCLALHNGKKSCLIRVL